MPIDRSLDALASGDYTLVLSACGATPGKGFDVCNVVEGTRIESSWKIFVPRGTNIKGGEVQVFYRDIKKTYAVTSGIVEIPWMDFFERTLWRSDMDGEVMALVQIRWMSPLGIEEITQYRGMAKIVVTKTGYSRIPIDSNQAAWGTNCKIQYSTAGRSVVECK